jgi:hypothetical protein
MPHPQSAPASRTLPRELLPPLSKFFIRGSRCRLTAYSIAGDIVDVQAGTGDETKIFYVYREVLAKSLFCYNAMKPEWARDPKKPIDLSDELPEIVEQYIKYLYCNSVAETTDFAILFRLYVLGNKLVHPDF